MEVLRIHGKLGLAIGSNLSRDAQFAVSVGDVSLFKVQADITHQRVSDGRVGAIAANDEISLGVNGLLGGLVFEQQCSLVQVCTLQSDIEGELDVAQLLRSGDQVLVEPGPIHGVDALSEGSASGKRHHESTTCLVHMKYKAAPGTTSLTSPWTP